MTLTKLNDSSSHPLRFTDGVEIWGQFYNSYDKKYHLAKYQPYVEPPKRYLCDGFGNFSPSRSDRADRHFCKDCFEILGVSP